MAQGKPQLNVKEIHAITSEIIDADRQISISGALLTYSSRAKNTLVKCSNVLVNY